MTKKPGSIQVTSTTNQTAFLDEPADVTANNTKTDRRRIAVTTTTSLRRGIVATLLPLIYHPTLDKI
ncbi:hypothetical protein Pmani_003792 [Petrolisthes manimaculis]|uniref:Uncharacterized protein n=1 Tax=Petrolisthes manimaculis TaxID=1843537 RepID=A0AAE1UM58_9EUCA|nr:hypothetical protein Pmani_003792 [Petrolisthes manimaculis]